MLSPSRREREREPHARTPKLPGSVVVRDSSDALLDQLASDIFVHAFNCVRAFGDFHIALSGGSTPQPLYRRLMYDPQFRPLPWARTHLWVVDERRVPFDDERSNWAMLRDLVAIPSDMPQEHAHPMDPLADDADIRYEQELVRVLGGRGPQKDRLDFALLGMGDDGHTASLFPATPPLRETRRLVRMNDGPRVTPPPRITMTFPLINAARFVAVLVTGEKKRATIARVEEAFARETPQKQGAPARIDPAALDELPILGVRPLAGDLRWYLDRSACPER